MTKRADDGGVAIAERPQESAARRPMLVIAAGRGKTGKSVLLSWLAENSAGRYPLKVIDADPNNQSLADRIPGAEMPPGIDDDRRAWIEKRFEEQMQAAGTADQHDILLDLGGGDLLLKRWGHEIALAEILGESGVDPVVIHMIGPDDADLSYLRDVEAGELFCPERTILVMNAGLVAGGRSAEVAFENVLASDIVKQCRGRGCKVVMMPALMCMREVDEANLTIAEAMSEAGGRKVGMLNKVRVKKWHAGMQAMRARLGDWLPE